MIKIIKKIVFWSLGILAFLVLMAFMADEPATTNSQPTKIVEIDPDAWKTENNSTMAYVQIQGFVKQVLKSPGSAKWPGFFDSVSHQDNIKQLGNQTYKVASYVDSQNGFGALIRSKYTGVVKQTSDDEWVLILLEIEGKFYSPENKDR